MSSKFLQVVSAFALVGVIALAALGQDAKALGTIAVVMALWAVVAAVRETQEAIIERIMWRAWNEYTNIQEVKPGK